MYPKTPKNQQKYLQNVSKMAPRRPPGAQPAPGLIFDRFLATFWLPFWSQKSIKWYLKVYQKSRCDLHPTFLNTWRPLGAFWPPFWRQFGIIFEGLFDPGCALWKESVAARRSEKTTCFIMLDVCCLLCFQIFLVLPAARCKRVP